MSDPAVLAIRRRFGKSGTNRLYQRIRSGESFAVFVVAETLSLVDYPSLRYSGMLQDHGHGLAGVYTRPTCMAEVSGDVIATAALLRGPA